MDYVDADNDGAVASSGDSDWAQSVCLPCYHLMKITNECCYIHYSTLCSGGLTRSFLSCGCACMPGFAPAERSLQVLGLKRPRPVTVGNALEVADLEHTPAAGDFGGLAASPVASDPLHVSLGPFQALNHPATTPRNYFATGYGAWEDWFFTHLGVSVVDVFRGKAVESKSCITGDFYFRVDFSQSLSQASQVDLRDDVKEYVEAAREVLSAATTVRTHAQARRGLKTILRGCVPAPQGPAFATNILHLAGEVHASSPSIAITTKLSRDHYEAVYAAITPITWTLSQMMECASVWPNDEYIRRHFGSVVGEYVCTKRMESKSEKCLMIDLYIDTAVKNSQKSVGAAWKVHMLHSCKIFPAGVLPYQAHASSKVVSEAAQIFVALLLADLLRLCKRQEGQHDTAVIFTGVSCDTQWAHIVSGRAQSFSIEYSAVMHELTARDLQEHMAAGSSSTAELVSHGRDEREGSIQTAVVPPVLDISDSDTSLSALLFKVDDVACGDSSSDSSDWSDIADNEADEVLRTRVHFLSPAVAAIGTQVGWEHSLGHTVRPDPLHVFRGVTGYYLNFLDQYLRHLRRQSKAVAAIRSLLAQVPGFTSPAGRLARPGVSGFTPWLHGGGPVFSKVCAMMAVLPVILAGVQGWTARSGESIGSYLQRENSFIQVAVDINLLRTICYSRGTFLEKDRTLFAKVYGHLMQSIDALPSFKRAGKTVSMQHCTHKFKALEEVFGDEQFASPMVGDCHQGELFMRNVRTDWSNIGTNRPFEQRHVATLNALWRRQLRHTDSDGLYLRRHSQVCVRGGRFGVLLDDTVVHVPSSRFHTPIECRSARPRLTHRRGDVVLQLGTKLQLSTQHLHSQVFGRLVMVSDESGEEHETLELCLAQHFDSGTDSGLNIVYKVLEYGASRASSSAASAIISESNAERFVNIGIDFDLRNNMSFRELAYTGHAHPLAAWAVPLRVREGHLYSCGAEDVLCKLRIVSMWGNMWWLLHGVERYECPGPGGDMHHEEYIHSS